ncbi:Spc98 family-domain-containing protein [Powellomyces hirtus]|nr:Spc98 family-domain-containing protein [Powellomyces hirtus]
MTVITTAHQLAPRRREQPHTTQQTATKALLTALLTHLSPRPKPLSARAVDVAYRQVTNHNYQHTNEHVIARRYEGLCEKFQMHGQTATADALNRCLGRLSGAPGLMVIYDVLRILLETSVSPTHKFYEPPSRKHAHEAELTWSGILDAEPLVGTHWDDDARAPVLDDDNGSEWDVGDDEEDSDDLRAERPSRDRQHRNAWSESPVLFDENEQVQLRLETPERDSGTRAMIDAQYWKYQSSDVTEDVKFKPDDPCSLIPSVAAHQKQNPLFFYRALAGDVFVHESNLVRECLFMLAAPAGPWATPVFDAREDGNVVLAIDKQMGLKHVSHGTLCSLLDWFAERGSAMHNVKNYVHRISSQPQVHTLTEQALVSCLLRLLGGLDHEIVRQEQVHQPYFREMKRSGIQQLGTLIALRDALDSPTTPFFDLQTILPPPHTESPSPAHTAASLLSRLYANVTTYEYTCQPHKTTLALELMVSALQPYLRLVQGWIYEGALEDPSDEFFVMRGTVEQRSREWQDSYIIRQPATNEPETASHFVVPELFESLKDAILVCGKSLKVIEQIDATQAMRFKTIAQRSLYDTVVDSVRKNMHGRLDQREGLHDGMSPETCPVTRDVPRGGNDIVRLFPKTCSALLGISIISRDTDINSTAPLSMGKNDIWQPVTDHLRTLLAHRIMLQQQLVGRRLTELLMRRCALKNHLKALQAVYLMTAGAVMHPFCDMLFEMAKTRELLSRPHALNSAFAESLATHGGNEFTFLDDRTWHFSVPPDVVRDKPVWQVLEAVTITHEVPHLLTPIIPPHTLNMYTRIARVLLGLKYAQQCLHSEGWGENRRAASITRASSGQKTKDDAIARTRAALKTRLLHFVINLQSFFLGAVIHAECTAFDNRLSTAQGMDELISVHETFISTLRDRCLLNDRARAIWLHVAKVLDLAMQYAALCQARDAGGERQDGEGHEEEVETSRFADALRELKTATDREVGIVQKDLEELARHGVAHLEALAAALAW